MDNAVTRSKGNTTSGTNKVRESVMCHNIYWFRIRCSVAEGLHHKISTESQTCQTFQLVTSHRTSSILRTNGSHERFAVLPWNNAIDSASFSDHFLGQGEAWWNMFWHFCEIESIRYWSFDTKRLTRLCSTTASNDEINTPSRSNFIKQDLCLQFKCGNNFIRAMFANFTFVRININDISHIHIVHIQLNRQSTGVFHRIEKNWSNLPSQANSTSF
mmetsp:Transcript_27616/g.41787  ORF Transcript_27616/g.41787 Transcript_27616/m.41787 type:complete len:216 (-) Transcript_27616:1162-1809(-)